MGRPAQHDGRYCEKLMKNAGIQVDTPEVLLSHHGLLEVCSFERLKCMEALWLNDNLLTKVDGLDANMQLKALYLHNNRISTLKGSLKFLRHIEMLALQNNRLTDLEATLKLMQHLTRLEELDLSGNPLANELNYRPRVIYRFPKLKVLDLSRTQITDAAGSEFRVLISQKHEASPRRCARPRHAAGT